MMRDFDWFAERLDLARWESQATGARSGFFGCPIHGGSDSLHITEKNSKALLNCFGCDAGTGEIIGALESVVDKVSETVQEDDTSTIRIRRTRGRVEDPEVERAALAGTTDTRGSTPLRLHQTPLAWAANRLVLTLKALQDLGLPLTETADAVVFEFPSGARKIRKAADGKAGKDFRWHGEDAPPLWPTPAKPGTEIAVTEGEFDAIALRASGIEAYSVTKGSQGAVPQAVWEALRQRGVKIVRVVFDLDDAGLKGRAVAVEDARAAGLDARESRVAGIQPLLGEKDARSVALRQGYPLELEDDADEDDATVLSEVEAATPGLSLLGFLHPLEHTILYGDGGTGKGVIAAWMVARLTMLKPRHERVLVVDYEQHASHEWRPRVEAFGGNMDEVLIVQPTRPIWEIAGWLRGQIERHSIDYVVVDSVSYACVGQEVEASSTAVQYSMAVATLQKPVLSIAHVTKADLDPKHPFGSVFWSNGARVTIAVAIQGDDPDSPRTMRNSKTNQHAPFPMVAVDWSWVIDELPSDLSFRPAFKSARAATQAYITVNGTSPSPEELAEFSGFVSTDNAIKQAKSGMLKTTKPPRVRRTKKVVDTGATSV